MQTNISAGESLGRVSSEGWWGRCTADQASMPPEMDWAFSKPCWRSHEATERRARAVVAEDEDGGFFVELLVGAAGDVAHGD